MIMINKTFSKIFFVSVFAFFMSATMLNGQIQWSRTYGDNQSTTDFSSLVHALPLADGGFVLTGYKRSTATYITLPQVIRVNALGNVIWQRTYSELPGAYIAKRCFLGKGELNFIIAGEISGQPGSQAFLMFLDGNGNFLKSKTYGHPDSINWFQNIVPTKDGNFMLRTLSSSFPNKTPYFRHDRLTKLTTSGEIIWDKIYTERLGGGGGKDILETKDGGFLMTTDSVTSVNGNQSSGRVIDFKVDANGKFLFTKPITALGGDYAGQFSDGRFVRAGEASQLISAVDDLGNRSWQLSLFGNDGIYSNFMGTTGGPTWTTVLRGDYAMNVITLLQNNTWRFFQSKINNQGRIIWTKQFPMTDQSRIERVRWVLETPSDSCILVVGEKDLGQTPLLLNVGWFAKFGNCSVVSTREVDGDLIKCQVLNNPMLNESVVRLQNAPVSTKGVFELIDIQGRLVQSKPFLGNTFVIERLNMTAGLYFIRIKTDDGKLGTEKLVVVD
jgi:hypothetical protein